MRTDTRDIGLRASSPGKGGADRSTFSADYRRNIDAVKFSGSDAGFTREGVKLRKVYR